MSSWISAPSLNGRATAAFRVSNLKKEGVAFLERVAAMLQQGPAEELEVPHLRLVPLEEELEMLHHMPHPARTGDATQDAGQQGSPQAAAAAQQAQMSPRMAVGAVDGEAGLQQQQGSALVDTAGQQQVMPATSAGLAPAAPHAGESDGAPSAWPTLHELVLADRGLHSAADPSAAAAAPASPQQAMALPEQLSAQAMQDEGAQGQAQEPEREGTGSGTPRQQDTAPAAALIGQSQRAAPASNQRQEQPPGLQQPCPAAPPAGRKLVTKGAALKPERQALLEAYQQAVEGVKRRRQEQLDAAGQVLHSMHSMLGQPRGQMAVGGTQEEAAIRELRSKLEESMARREVALPQDLVAPGEIVLHVCVYLPHFTPASSATSSQPPCQELLVLGSQSLTALRDAVDCLTDRNVVATQEQVNQVRVAGGQPPLQLAKGSAYLYVEGTFYNDMRWPGAADYSEPIRIFNREHRVSAPPHPAPGALSAEVLTTEFSTARMETATFDQLWLRLGTAAVNLYCHQGGCEHAVVFKDVRLFDPDSDPPLASQYPFQLHPPPHGYHRHCEVCHSATAKKVTYDDPQTPHTPFFWCKECFKMMHYDVQGRATHTNYRVFPYSFEHRPSKPHKQGGAGGKHGAGAAAP